MAFKSFEEWLKSEAYQIELPSDHPEFSNMKGLKDYLSDWPANMDKKEVNLVIKDLVDWLKGYDPQPLSGMSPMNH